MSKDKSSHRKILKATSIFGSVQVFNILFSILRSKIIAILLGPAGMGISGIFTSTIQLISQLTSFGLGTSSVRNISEAYHNGKEVEMETTYAVLKKWVWLTGFIGVICTLFLSKWLSIISFGSDKYTYEFMALSIVLLFMQLNQGYMAFLQGTGKIKFLAKADVIGVLASFFTSIPLYYFYGVKGIVPAMIISSFILLLVSYYYASKVNIKPLKISWEEVWHKGKDMLLLGFMLTLRVLISSITSYIIRIYVSREGGVEDVGFYSAGFTIINTYVGMVFAAMGTDFYPRLASVAKDNEASRLLVNQQAEVAGLILTPILIVFLVFIKWGILLLYSDQFTPIISMVQWAVLGTFFKSGSWAMAYLFLAKGDTKTFFWNELFANFFLLILSLLGYKFFGLEGLGISYLVFYIVYFIQVYIICNKRYNFYFYKNSIKMAAVQIGLGCVTFILVKNASPAQSYFFGTLLILLTSYITYRELDKIIGIKKTLQKFIDSRRN